MRVHGVVVISGANRGIGFEITRALLANPNVTRVYAGSRDLTKTDELKSLPDPDKKLCLIQLDVSKDWSIRDAVTAVTKESGHLNLLINNSAILEQDRLAGIPDGDRTAWQRHFDVNITSHAMMIQSFLPLLQESVMKNDTATVVNISGLKGSIEKCPGTSLVHGNYAYMCSKAALNMLSKITSVEFPSILTVSICPGWNQTSMGGPKGLKRPSETAPVLLRTIDGLNMESSGLFIDRKGVPIPY